MGDLERLKELDLIGPIDTPEVMDLALRVYQEGFASHQCHWNDRFYIAVRFGLSKEHQRTAVVNSIVCNGRSGYFEAITHSEFNNFRLLRDLGIEIKGGRIHTGKEYQHLPGSLIESITRKFGIDVNDRDQLLKIQGDSYDHSRDFVL